MSVLNVSVLQEKIKNFPLQHKIDTVTKHIQLMYRYQLDIQGHEVDGVFNLRPSYITKFFHKPALERFHIKNKEEVINQKLQDGGLRGRLIHEYAEMGKIESDIPEHLKQEVENGCKAYDQFMRENEIQTIASEVWIYSKKLKIIGKCDRIDLFNGNLMISDWKGGGWGDTFGAQLEFYRVGFMEMFGIDIGTQVVTLDKNTALPKPFPFTHHDFVWDTFCSCIQNLRQVGKQKLHEIWPHYGKGLTFYINKGENNVNQS